MFIPNVFKLSTYAPQWAKKREVKAAIKEANELHELTGYKYYVLHLGGKYRALNMGAIKMLKKNGILPKTFDWYNAEKNALYVTKSKNNGNT